MRRENQCDQKQDKKFWCEEKWKCCPHAWKSNPRKREKMLHTHPHTNTHVICKSSLLSPSLSLSLCQAKRVCLLRGFSPLIFKHFRHLEDSRRWGMDWQWGKAGRAGLLLPCWCIRKCVKRRQTTPLQTRTVFHMKWQIAFGRGSYTHTHTH